MNFRDLDNATFERLPLVIEGESKIVRYLGDGLVVIRYKPTIFSFTHNRCGEVSGSDVLRLRATRVFLEVLRSAGIKHVYREVTDRFVIADLVLPSITECAKYGCSVFAPSDMAVARCDNLSRTVPIEVVIKRYHSGTPKHRYIGMSGSMVRASHPLYAGMSINAEDALPSVMVRFDWRNPLRLANGTPVADEVLPEDLADLYIDTKQARKTALSVYVALQRFLEPRDIVLCDLCLFITEDGSTVYGEISQDCGRFRHFELGSLDKDVWRSGGSSADVYKKWELLLKHIERSV